MTLDYTETQDNVENDVTDETPKVSFEDLGISDEILASIRDMGFEAPTDVQAQAIPLALAGRDLLVQSRTGSGKTAAFAIPAASKIIDLSRAETQALVLAPTRELAIQVGKEVGRIAARSDLTTTAIYGGAAMGPQIDALQRGVHFLAATPGRLLDHLRRGHFKPDTIRLLVLDEADEMLSMGFLEEINTILDALPKTRQTMLFSATIPSEIERLSEHYLKNPERLYLSEDFVGVREIDHVYYRVTGGNRLADLLKVLSYENPKLALIFCNTREDTARVASFLDSEGFPTEGISSDLTQHDRERVMKRMRAGELRFLCATDIAARGIDISDLSHVINYTFPDNADIYVHRTGRTGRAGKSGVAISLVSPREIGSFYYLKLIHKIYPEERHLPSAEEQATRHEGELYQVLTERYAGLKAQPLHIDLLHRVWSTADGERLLALTLEELLDKPRILRQAAAPSSQDRPVDREAEGDRAPRRSRSDSRDDRGRGRHRGRDGGRDRGDRNRSRSPRNDRPSAHRRPADDVSRDHDAGDRKRTRTRSRSRNTDRRPSTNDTTTLPENVNTFTTADGEVELYETLPVSTGTSSEVEKKANSPKRERLRPIVDEEGMTRLYVNVGRRHEVRPEDLTSFFQIAGELDAGDIGSISQRDRHSYVNVREAIADEVISRLTGKALAGRDIRVERAKL